MINDFQVIEQLNIIIKSRIIIYGCGVWGKRVLSCLEEMNIRPDMVCETKAADKLFGGMRVHSIKEVKRMRDEEDVLILLCSEMYYGEMVKECENLKFENCKIATLFAFFISLKMHSGEGGMNKIFEARIVASKEYSIKRLEQAIMIGSWDMMIRAANLEEGIIIYQPGKVGSQSIGHSIKHKSIQLHTLAIPYARGDIDCQLADYYIECLKNKKKLKIITAVREPIARDLAALFQNSDNELWPLDSTNSNVFWWYGDYYNNRSHKLDFEQVRLRNQGWKGSLVKSFDYLSDIIKDFALDEFSWFDYELKSIFDIDIYQYPFNKSRGYAWISKENIEVLVLKTEKLFQLRDVIAKFIEDENYTLDSTNQGKDKIYRYAYKEFKNKVKIKEDYYNYYYKNNVSLSHFYTEEELKGFREYWKARIE